MIVDSFAWIELLAGSEHEDQVRLALSQADVVLTPDIVLAEVARKLARDGVLIATARRKVRDIASLSQVIPIDEEIALSVFHADVELRQAAEARRLRHPGLSDAIILATARQRRGKVLTGDPHFEGLSDTLWLGGRVG